MILYLVALVVILCTIFGLTYSQASIHAIRDGGEHLSTIQLPTFLHRTPLIHHHSQAGVEGDNGIAMRSSQQSLEISSQGMEEANSGEDQMQENLHQLERRILQQKLKDANQIGLTESLWPQELQAESDKVIKELLNNQKYASDTSKPVLQKINTNTIFNMIQYETFKEAMAIIKNQQEEEEAARMTATNGQHGNSTENASTSLPEDEHNEKLPTNDRNIKRNKPN